MSSTTPPREPVVRRHRAFARQFEAISEVWDYSTTPLGSKVREMREIAKRISDGGVAPEACARLTTLLDAVDVAGFAGESALREAIRRSGPDAMAAVRSIQFEIDKQFGQYYEGSELAAKLVAIMPGARTLPPAHIAALNRTSAAVDVDAFGASPDPVQGGLL